MTTHVYSGEAYRCCDPTPAEEVEISEAISNIRSMYDSGARFCTRVALQDLLQQLEAFEKGQTISVRALNGNLVDFNIESGRTHPTSEPHLEFVLCEEISIVMCG